MKKEMQDMFEESYQRNTTTIEEYVDISDSLIELEKNNELIRMEMNIIEFPIFSKSSKIKKNQAMKYYFNSEKTSFLEIIPTLDETIPGETEERVFIALLKIFKEKGYKQTFYCTANDILNNMNVENRGTRNGLYSKIRSAIKKLSETNYRFKNLFYSNEINKVVDDFIRTTIFSSRKITISDANNTEKKLFEDGRIKEIYEINISKHFYENIIKKGYLTFDAEELLNIKDSVTRSIYTQITKWRNNKLYLKRPAFFIARKIPLAWKGTNVRKTVIRIEKSLEELKNTNYIKDFKTIKNGKVDTTEFEIFFSDEHNKIKQKNFYDEKSDFNIIHSVEERQNQNNINLVLENKDSLVSDILTIFGERGKLLKTLPTTISEALKKYDFDYVKNSAEYTIFNAKVSILKYFKDTLNNHWADEYIASKQEKQNKRIKQESKIIEEAVIVEEKHVENNCVWEEFTALDEEYQRKIENDTYLNFLKEAEGTDNKIMRGIFEKSKKSLILKDLKNYIEKEEIVEVELKESIGIEVTFINLNHFIGEILEKAVRQGIIFDKIKIENINMLLSVLGQYEDTFMKVSWNEEHKKGMLILK